MRAKHYFTAKLVNQVLLEWCKTYHNLKEDHATIVYKVKRFKIKQRLKKKEPYAKLFL